MTRFWMGGAVAAWLGPSYPWGTILINIIGLHQHHRASSTSSGRS
jgi:fluoride ion exporter CrcB/FEX